MHNMINDAMSYIHAALDREAKAMPRDDGWMWPGDYKCQRCGKPTVRLYTSMKDDSRVCAGCMRKEQVI